VRPELYDEQLRDQTLSDPDSRYRLLQSWASLVEEYSLRHLTMPEDKLSAIAGIAREYSENLDVPYFVGFIEELLPEALLWSVVPGTQRLRPSKHRAPCFSWAAVDSPVKWPQGFSFGEGYTHRANWWAGLIADGPGESRSHRRPIISSSAATVLDKGNTSVKPNASFGTISYATLRLRAPVSQAEWLGYTHESGAGEFDGRARLEKVDGLVIIDAIDDIYLELMQSRSVLVYLVGLAGGPSWRAIACSSSDGQVFRRLGVVKTRTGWDHTTLNATWQWEWREITLI
jgi:hypothetical protein